METISGLNRKRGRKGTSEAQKDKIVKMYKMGMSMSMIVSSCGVSYSTVYRILNERTVERREEENN
jgi:DNA invertase Pin-like site-specific DNA recombinase